MAVLLPEMIPPMTHQPAKQTPPGGEFTEEQQEEMVDIYRENPRFYNKESLDFYKGKDKRAKIFADTAKKMGKILIKVQTWYETMRMKFGKLTADGPSGRGKKNLTSKDKWILNRFDFLRAHIVRSGGKEFWSIRQQVPAAAIPEEDPQPSTSTEVPPARRPARASSSAEDAQMAEILQMIKDHKQEEKAEHPIIKTYTCEKMELWKHICHVFFLDGRQLDEDFRDEAGTRMLAVMADLKAQNRRRREQQQAGIFQQQFQQQPALDQYRGYQPHYPMGQQHQYPGFHQGFQQPQQMPLPQLTGRPSSAPTTRLGYPCPTIWKSA